jgi:hypothetical protein
VAGDIDDVVDAAHDDQVTILIEIPTVAGEVVARMFTQVRRFETGVVAPERGQGAGRQWQRQADRTFFAGSAAAAVDGPLPPARSAHPIRVPDHPAQGQTDPGGQGGRRGRNVDDIDKMIEIKISYDTDPDLALENTRFWAPLSLTAEQKNSIHDPIEMEKAADALPIEQVAKRWIVSSDPDEAVEKVGEYVTYGLNHLVFHAPGHDQRRFLELFEKDLAPRLRKLA